MQAEQQPKPKRERIKKQKKRESHLRWFIFIPTFAFSIALMIGIFTESVFRGTNSIAVCVVILLSLIAIAFIGDIFAVAGAYADISVFNSMAARRIKGAKAAIKLVKNSDRVSSILSDVLGDVCAIVSGAVGVSLSLVVIKEYGIDTLFHQGLTVALINATVSALAITAKSIAKKIAIANSTQIVIFFGKFLSKFGVR